MSDLIAFLKARLDEDEASARKARKARDEAADNVPGGDYTAGWADGYREGLQDAAWDPARVLAEVAKSRAILDRHGPDSLSDYYRACTSCADWDGAAEFEGPPSLQWPCPTALALAQPYAEHPDFDPAWAPEPNPAFRPGMHIQAIGGDGPGISRADAEDAIRRVIDGS